MPYLPAKKSYAGVATLTRSEPKDVQVGFDDGLEPDMPRLILLRVDGVWVLNTYVPQGRSIEHEMYQYKLAWLKRVRALLESRFQTDDPLLWVGDLNVAPTEIDLYNPKGNLKHPVFSPEVREVFAEVCAWGLTDVLRTHHPEAGVYTYFDYRVRGALDRGVGWRIDHIMATEVMAARSQDCWVDIEARRAERPSDHTFLVGEFSL